MLKSLRRMRMFKGLNIPDSYFTATIVLSKGTSRSGTSETIKFKVHSFIT
jgi:hypothetical protein